MHLEKVHHLQATSDTQPIISASFILNAQLTDLYLYPNELKLLQKNKDCTIPIGFELTFSLIPGPEGPIGIELTNKGQKLRLIRDFWPQAQEWEKALLSCMTQQNFHEFFKPIKKIGKGNFASVYLAEDLRKKRKVAVKAFMKETGFKGDGKKSIQNQIKIMRIIKSKSIVELHGVFETTNSLYLSMEYLQGTTLESYLKKNKEITAQNRRRILRALLIGLRDMKGLRIVHRDIKPENIIISTDLESIKIIDFGLATVIDQPAYIFVRCGTPGYIAPEIMRIRDPQTARMGVESDMFSLGAIYYQLLYGRHLFNGKDNVQVLHNNRMCHLKMPLEPLNAEYGQIQLLRGMLEQNPFFRVNPEQALNNAFLRQQKLKLNRQALQSLQNIQFSSSEESM